jgi:hypothetical protein
MQPDVDIKRLNDLLVKAHIKTFWEKNRPELYNMPLQKVFEIGVQEGYSHSLQKIEFLQEQVMDLDRAIRELKNDANSLAILVNKLKREKGL